MNNKTHTLVVSRVIRKESLLFGLVTCNVRTMLLGIMKMSIIRLVIRSYRN